MKKDIFESKILADGHLHCPDEFTRKKNAHFKVVVTYDEIDLEASDQEVQLSAIKDTSGDFLSDEELNYYFNLKEL